MTLDSQPEGKDAKRKEYLMLKARDRRKRETAAAKEVGITVQEYRVMKSAERKKARVA